MNKSWHPDHFFCALCGKLFDEDNLNFFEKDGKAYCKEDYFDKFAVTCKRCSKAIMSGYLSAVGSYWHPNCFSCKVCEVGQVGGSLGFGWVKESLGLGGWVKESLGFGWVAESLGFGWVEESLGLGGLKRAWIWVGCRELGFWVG